MNTEDLVIALTGKPSPKKGLAEINEDLRSEIETLRLEKKSLGLRNQILELQLLAHSYNNFEH
jgi:hypothetical protein